METMAVKAFIPVPLFDLIRTAESRGDGMLELRELIQALEPIVGRPHLETSHEVTGRYGVDGLMPRLVASPADAAQTAALIATAARLGVAVIPWGGGTAMGRGHVPAAYDVALSLARLDGIVDYDIDNLTVTVQAGLSLSRLQAALGERRQFLPLDPPFPDVATVGGIIAANSSGPSRVRYGSVRDLVLGMRVALPGGEVIHVGGKTVKNVAGYDLSKMFIGSYGTLGIVTEVTFRLLPLPAEKRALWVGCAERATAHRLAGQILDSTLLPTYLTVLNRSAIRRTRPEGGDAFALVIGLDGSPETVERQVRDITALVVSAQVIEGDALSQLERALRNFAGAGRHVVGAGLGATASVPISAAEHLCGEVDATADVAAMACVPSGTVHILVEGREIAELASAFEQAVAAADRLGGHCIVDWAAPAVKARIQVWGTPRPEWRLSQAVKKKFDPTGALNRGRFVAGI
jgi:glycolate oxidase FAD binding subunit